MDFSLELYELTNDERFLEVVENTLRNQYTDINELEENYNLLAKDAIQRKKVADKNLKGLTGLSEIISNPKSGYIDGQDQTLQPPRGRSIDLEMMCLWISLVPSQIRSTRVSRHIRSRGNSSMRPIPPKI